jgi:lysozyme
MSKITTLDQKGFDFIALNEGNVLHPYLDTAGVPTIGIGMTFYPDTGKRVTIHDPHIAPALSQHYFTLMVKSFEHNVSAITRDDLTQDQFNALVDFDYNTGHLKGSTLLKCVNAKEDVTAAFLMWDKEHVNGKLVENEELKARRLREIKMYNSK